MKWYCIAFGVLGLMSCNRSSSSTEKCGGEICATAFISGKVVDLVSSEPIANELLRAQFVPIDCFAACDTMNIGSATTDSLGRFSMEIPLAPSVALSKGYRLILKPIQAGYYYEITNDTGYTAVLKRYSRTPFVVRMHRVKQDTLQMARLSISGLLGIQEAHTVEPNGNPVPPAVFDITVKGITGGLTTIRHQKVFTNQTTEEKTYLLTPKQAYQDTLHVYW